MEENQKDEREKDTSLPLFENIVHQPKQEEGMVHDFFFLM